jgi:hypothetical protein
MLKKAEYPSSTLALASMSPDSGCSASEAKEVLRGAVCMLTDVYHLNVLNAFDHCLSLFPKDFRMEAIPHEWLQLEEPISPVFLTKITPFHTLYDALPNEQEDANPDLFSDLIRRYIYVVTGMYREHLRWREAESRLFPFQLHGTQWIADWEVRDLSLQNDPSKRNWHGQNTSQWRFAGCLLVQNGRVSVHT